jgi:hypothetical protein
MGTEIGRLRQQAPWSQRHFQASGNPAATLKNHTSNTPAISRRARITAWPSQKRQQHVEWRILRLDCLLKQALRIRRLGGNDAS